MAWFQNMGDAEKFRIVSLPFRVGLWMSLADDVPGGQDDRDELDALERILRVIAKTHDQTPFLQATVHETLKYKKLWKKWRGYNENTLRDTHVALRELLKRRGAEDMKVYRIMLYKIAEAVAAAYNENAYDPDKKEEKESFWEGLSSFFKTTDMKQRYLNISEPEAKALERLKQVMVKSVSKKAS